MEKEIKKFINKIKNFAAIVFKDLGSGWEESVYQKAMEVILRLEGIDYEEQRTLPITFKGHIVGEGYPDLICWFKYNDKKVGIVIDLKYSGDITEEYRFQVLKYIKELKKTVKKNEIIYDTGLVINFTKPSGSKIKDEIEDIDGLKILEVQS
jgi:GxxExxY protein